jgi:ORF6N domain
MRILVSRCRTLARMLKRVVHCRDSAQGRLSVASRRQALAPVEPIARAILVLRGHRVLLDAELATLYGVTTKRLNEQVKRSAPSANSCTRRPRSAARSDLPPTSGNPKPRGVLFGPPHVVQ